MADQDQDAGRSRRDFFVSHSGADRAWAEWVSWQLVEAGYSVELDVWDWAPGRNFVTAMSDALDRCDRVLALFSAAYFDRSRYTTEEWSAALVRVPGVQEGRLVPVRVEDVPVAEMPPILRSLVFCDVFGMGTEQARQRLLEAVSGPERPNGEPQFPDSVMPGARTRRGNPEPQFPGSMPRLVNAPLRNPAFTGRSQVLEQLGQLLAAGPVSVVAVRGLGGMGKSQLALEYAYRMCESGRYGVAGWVRADSAVTVAQDLAALAPLLGIDTDGPIGELAASVVAALQLRRDWLVVFDNAQSPGDLSGMLPSGGGHVLITSRRREWSGIASQLDLEEFSRAESVAFLGKRSRRTEPDAAAELAAELGDLPLALAQAAAYIDARALTVNSYLALYRDPVLACRLRDEGLESGEYPASVARTLLLSLAQLSSERPAAVELLRLCAFLDSDDIDLSTLGIEQGIAGKALSEAIADALLWTETIGTLARASLISRRWDQNLRVHRLVQAITRDQLNSRQANRWAGRVLTLLDTAFPAEPWLPMYWQTCAGLAAHINAAVTWAHTYPKQARRCGRLLTQLGLYLMGTAQYAAARATLERALDIKESAWGQNHPEVATTLTNLGSVRQQLGDLADARANQERALAIFESAYGPNHPEVARVLGNLGIVQYDLYDLDGAHDTQERALGIEEAFYGPDHPVVAKTLGNLGNIHRQLGDLEGAHALLSRVLVIFESAYGPQHPDVVTTLDNLGIVEQRLGDLDAARATLEHALAAGEASYGPDHPAIAMILDDLGTVQYDLGDLDATCANLERAAAIKESAYGPDHPDLAETLTRLASAHEQLGDLDAARATEVRALAIKESAYGPDHPEVARILGDLGVIQVRLDDLDAACSTLERALAIFEAAYGPDHPDIAKILGNLGVIQLQLGDLSGARNALERVLGVLEAVNGPDHPDVARMLGNLGVLELRQGNLDAARTALERALAIFEAAYGPSNPEVTMTVANLSEVHRAANQPSDL
jgi:tetratricopeptide (TPR) repeat protein